MYHSPVVVVIIIIVVWNRFVRLQGFSEYDVCVWLCGCVRVRQRENSKRDKNKLHNTSCYYSV